MWGVESRDLQSLNLTGRFPGYESWTVVSSHQPDILLTNAMAVIEFSSSGPRLPPRLHMPDSRRTTAASGAPGTPAAAGGLAPDQVAAAPPPAPTAKTPRSATGNGRRHRKKEFQIQPSRARCEVGRRLASWTSGSDLLRLNSLLISEYQRLRLFRLSVRSFPIDCLNRLTFEL